MSEEPLFPSSLKSLSKSFQRHLDRCALPARSCRSIPLLQETNVIRLHHHLLLPSTHIPLTQFNKSSRVISATATAGQFSLSSRFPPVGLDGGEDEEGDFDDPDETGHYHAAEFKTTDRIEDRVAFLGEGVEDVAEDLSVRGTEGRSPDFKKTTPGGEGDGGD